MGLTPDEAAIAAAMPKARIVLDEITRHLGERPYLAGEALSLADLLVAPQVDFLSATPEWTLLTTGNAVLRRWLERMNARPSMAATTWERVAAMARVSRLPESRQGAGA